MTKKDYELIAKAMLKSSTLVNRYSAEDLHKLICLDLAIKLQDSNPRFDRQRFLEACGVDND